ncbi:MAG: hypothetical protein EOP83_35070 [Verrucomicrobiaceae bacterium]|nr:MAG: hypothetical protein EOP83_35070 [Verrucomicrobiaceae bacterium]
MPCIPKRSLTPVEAPYEITMAREVRWKEGREQMLWLVEQNNDCQGFFTNGRRRLGGSEVTWYRFTCPLTAFRFKLQFS